MENENIFLLYALLMGIFITFVYDILRILRRTIPHGDFMIAIEDMSFWFYCAVKVFVLMYHDSNGTLRWFAIFGALVGMLIYKKLVSTPFVKYSSMGLRKLLGIITKIGKVVFHPLFVVSKKGKKAAEAGKRRMVRRRNHLVWFLKKRLTFLRNMLK